jgi:hypothetical protein
MRNFAAHIIRLKMATILEQRITCLFKDEDQNEHLSLDFDKEYRLFMKRTGGGVFFENSMIIYPYFNTVGGYNYGKVNNFISETYKLDKEILCFGCDLFGNQFIFYSEKVYLFDIESAEIELLANDFLSFCELFNDPEHFYYLTGWNVLSEWVNLHGRFSIENRLSPKFPFLIGGNYVIDNLYVFDFYKRIDYAASIYHQIKDLPDGTPVQLAVTNSGKI